MKITLTINNKKPKTFETPANLTLMEFLRAQGLWSVKHGCETGNCGSCTVLVDGVAVNSCIMLAAQADGKSIETFENIRHSTELNLLKETLMDFGDIECGYCIPGMMMSMKALLQQIPEPTVEELVDSLAGNVCRCTKSVKPVNAILEAVKKMRGKW